MTYKYWPSRGEESDANNEIRQWMATIALIQIAQRRADPALVALAEKNLQYNLGMFYHEEDGLGLIEYRGKVKLGALALAALAIAEHPNRQAFSRQEAALRQTVDSLWHSDGSFRTFYRPAARNDNQNFYSGEALLLWAHLYSESHDAELLGRIMTSFRYYRRWHLANRNPAFVPWHTQAYAIVWNITRDPALLAWIFEMNDWLVALQRAQAAPYGDVQGDFYDAGRPDFGPPHASSTGVYLQGLVDAWQIADATSDTRRTTRYAEASIVGFRSSLQLAFTNSVDTYYVRALDRVTGALRTTPWNNEVRIDNVQHTVMATQSALTTGLFHRHFTPPQRTSHPGSFENLH
jgi:hypothetical protein